MVDKFAVINSVFDYGSTGSLARQLYEYGMSIGYEGYVFYGRGKKYEDEHVIRIDSKIEVYGHKLLSLLTGLQGSYSRFATRKMLNVMKKNGIKHVIFLNLHGYYLHEKKLFNFCRKEGIRIIYVMPDEYAGLGKCCYCDTCEKFKNLCVQCPKVKDYPKSLFFDSSKHIFINKLNEYENQDITFVGPRANIDHLQGARLLEGKCVLELDWGIDLGTYHFSVNEEIYTKYGIPRDRILVLTVAKYSMTRKGVAEYFFKAAKRLENSQYHFINVGYDGNLSISQMPKNMTTIPYIDSQEELAQIYSICDLYVLASTSDSQPLSALIALGCETPVACFYTSGLRYISNGDDDVVRYAKAISVESLTELIYSFGKKTETVKHKCKQYSEQRYSKDLFNKNVFEKLFVNQTR